MGALVAMAASLAALGSLAIAGQASATPLGRSAFVTTGFGSKAYYWPSPANTPANSLPALNAKRVAITPDGAHAYVAGTASDVVVLDIATSSPSVSPSSPIAVTGASDVAIAPDGLTAYVGSSITNNITKIDIATNTISGTIDNGNSQGNLPNSVAVTPDGAKIVAVTLGRVSDSKSVVTVRNTSDGSLVGTPLVLGAGDNADSVAITPDGTKAYVANSANFNTEVVNVSNSTLDTTVSSGGNHSGVAITPDGSRAYVPNQNGNDVTIIDTATDTVDPDSPVSTAPGLNPVGIAITPDGSTAYVPNSNASGPGPVNASVINVAADTLGTPVSFGAFPGDNPNSAAVTPDQGPTAAFGATPGAATSPTSFNATGSTDPDGTVVNYDWNFGDSTTATTATPTTTHTYATGGNYSVTLRVTDNEGCSNVLVFTGHTAYCNPNTLSPAQTGSMVTIPAAPTPPPSGGGGTTTTSPTLTPLPTASGQRAAALKKCKKKHGAARTKCKKKANKLPV
jgi:YVTN family beta-propeller protein